MYLLDLLGKTMDNPAVKAFQKRFPHYDLEPTDRGWCSHLHFKNRGVKIIAGPPLQATLYLLWLNFFWFSRHLPGTYFGTVPVLYMHKIFLKIVCV